MQSQNTAREAGIDLQDLMVRVDQDLDLLREVFEIFEEEFPPLYQTLADAAQRGDMKAVHVAAHTLKGMLASLSFSAAAASARLLEQMAGEPNPRDLSPELSRLQNQVATGRAFLARLCRGVAA